MKYEDHFYKGCWPEVPYTSKHRRSPLGHYYVQFITDHPQPVKNQPPEIVARP